MFWPHDDRDSMNAFYGDPRSKTNANLPDHDWIARNITNVQFPWHATYNGQTVKSCQFHKRAAQALADVFDDLWTNACGKTQSNADHLGISIYSGAFNFRPVRGALKLSCHAYGCAIDFNAAQAAMGQRGGMPAEVVKAFARLGGTWGGSFHSRPDPMHFQFANETLVP